MACARCEVRCRMWMQYASCAMRNARCEVRYARRQARCEMRGAMHKMRSARRLVWSVGCEKRADCNAQPNNARAIACAATGTDARRSTMQPRTRVRLKENRQERARAFGLPSYGVRAENADRKVRDNKYHFSPACSSDKCLDCRHA